MQNSQDCSKYIFPLIHLQEILEIWRDLVVSLQFTLIPVQSRTTLQKRASPLHVTGHTYKHTNPSTHQYIIIQCIKTSLQDRHHCHAHTVYTGTWQLGTAYAPCLHKHYTLPNSVLHIKCCASRELHIQPCFTIDVCAACMLLTQ